MLLKISSITLIASLSLIVPLIIGTINLREIRNNHYGVLYWYLIIYAIFEVIAWYYALNGLQNHFLGNTVIYLDLFFIGWYYYLILSDETQKKIVLGSILIATIIVIWSHFATGRDYNRLDSFALSVENIVIILISLLFFYQLLNSLEVKNLFIYSHFWIGTALLSYFSVIFFLDLFAEYVAFNKNKDFASSYWDIKEYLTFFHRIFLAIGLWFSKTPIQSNLSSK
ncbi:MAG: hypothetical protein U5N85_12000 [Arcicella sp.]|nr:hypothetical protein [Arcicella sp.]